MWARKFYLVNLLRSHKSMLLIPENFYGEKSYEIKARKLVASGVDKKKVKAPKAQKLSDLVDPLASLERFNSSVESKELTKFIIKNLPFHQMRLLPGKFLRIQKTPSQTVCIAEETTAREIATILKKEKLDPNSLTIEINPAFGLLTRKLVHELKLNNLTGFEELSAFFTRLTEEFETQKGVNFVQYSFINIPRTYYQDRVDNILTSKTESRLGKIFTHVYNKEIKVLADKLYIIGPTPKISVISFLVRCYSMKTFLFEENLPFKKVIFYFIVGQPIKDTLTATSDSSKYNYRAVTVLFNSFFDFEVLGEFPRKAFLPWDRFIDIKTSSLNLKKKAFSRSFSEKVYLMKLSTNGIIEKELGPEYLYPFFFFVRHHLKSRMDRIIPSLEQWIPGCGDFFIRKGLTIYTTFGSRTPEEIYEIFKGFIRMPEYKESSFPNAVEKSLFKIEDFGELYDSQEKKRPMKKRDELHEEEAKKEDVEEASRQSS